MSDQSPKGRAYEKRFEVAAPIDQVWKAITEGEELSRWFCESAETKGGVGGYQTVDWGGGMVGTQDITAWEPPFHFRAEARAAEQSGRGLEAPGGEPYATDWYLEHEGGVTRVRMVASGFGEGGAWDGEYDGTFKGWDMFHQNLKHYLENFPGKSSASIVIMALAPEGPIAAFDKMFGPEGFCAEGTVQGLKDGEAFTIKAATGDTFQGRVRIADPSKRSFHAIVDSHDGVMNFESNEMGGAGFLWMNLLTWGRPQEEIDGLRERLGGMMSTLFPTPLDPGAFACAPEAVADEH